MITLGDECISQVLRAANIVRDLRYEDYRVLVGIELGMRRYVAPPLEQISFYARLTHSETQHHLDHLHKMGILQRFSDLGYIGYQLISEAYDVLALHALVEKNQIISVGDAIGRGKESDVFYAQRPDNSHVAIKIHRIGQNSFRQVRRFRSYIQDRRHISWLYIDRLSAEREYSALERLAPFNLGTPIPYGQNRHIVIMSLITGIKLSNVPNLDNPADIIDQLIAQIEIIFVQLGMIHCDLSEFNILITPDQKVLIIDWPQWEPAEHPNAHLLLTRDLDNIARFFTKFYNHTIEVEVIVNQFIKARHQFIIEHGILPAKFDSESVQSLIEQIKSTDLPSENSSKQTKPSKKSIKRQKKSRKD